MRYRQLGRSGLRVSELGLGTMTFGGRDGWEDFGGVQPPDAEAMIERALATGVTFFDSADVYSGGLAETILGQSLKNLGVNRSDVVIATKAFGATGPGPNERGSSRIHLLDAVKLSLERLATDYIDLYQMHCFDPHTPVEETLRTLDDLVSEGLVRYVGCSNMRAWQIMKALGISSQRGWMRYESLQAHYTLASRDIERETVSLLEDQGLGLIVWSPLGGGLLSGKFDRDHAPQDARRSRVDHPPIDRERAYACIEAMRPVAEAHGVSVAQVALAWLLHQPHVTCALTGAMTMEQLDDDLAAADLRLADDELAALNAAGELPEEYPAWMIDSWVD